MTGILIVEITAAADPFTQQREIARPRRKDDQLVSIESHVSAGETDGPRTLAPRTLCTLGTQL